MGFKLLVSTDYEHDALTTASWEPSFW